MSSSYELDIIFNIILFNQLEMINYSFNLIQFVTYFYLIDSKNETCLALADFDQLCDISEWMQALLCWCLVLMS